jgi:ABC-type antimicrobial peptide transport system ATPase subunit
MRSADRGHPIFGEAVKSLLLRASTSPEARQLIAQAVLKDPLYAAASAPREDGSRQTQIMKNLPHIGTHPDHPPES